MTTKKKITTQKNKESDKKFEDIINISSDWVWETDAQGRYTYVSKGVKKILGYDPKEVIGKTPFDFMLPKEAKRVSKEFVDIVKKRKKIVDLENLNLTKDKKEVYLLTNGLPVMEGEKLVGYRGIDKDITQIKFGEKKLKESEEYLKQLFESMPSGVVVYRVENEGQKFYFKSFNKKAEELENLKSDKVIGTEIREYFPGAEEMGMIKMLQKIYKNGKSVFIPQAEYRDKKGNITYRENYIYRLSGGDIVVIYDDVTSRVARVQELEKMNKLMVGRELKMIELKEKIKKYEKKAKK